jgi:P4 family phage/plasmid primase-like protien
VGICKYNDGVYDKECDNELFADLRKTLTLIYYEFEYLLGKEQIQTFKKLWLTKGIGEFTTINAVEKYLRRMLELQAQLTDFDNEDQNILNINNGYYDLDKQELKPHNPDKLFFKKQKVDYNEKLNLGLKYDDWSNFLNQTFSNDQNKIRYLQKAMGYTFSTSIKEEKVFLIKGVTRSGKNTFLETIGEILSEYSDTENEDFIVSHDKNTNYLLDVRAQLKGKRFLHISEISPKSRINSTILKNLAGDKYITGAEKFRGKIRYKNQVKYWIATNNLDFDSFDESVKTKLAVIEFNNRFYEEGTKEAKETGRVIDKNLKEKLLLPHNREIILKWIIEGYRLYIEEGLQSTEEMKETLDQVERDNDSLHTFFSEHMVQFDEQTKTIKDRKDVNQLHQIYSNFEQKEYGTAPEKIMTLRKFFKVLRNRGYKIKRFYQNCERSYYLDGWCLIYDKQEDKYNTVDES